MIRLGNAAREPWPEDPEAPPAAAAPAEPEAKVVEEVVVIDRRLTWQDRLLRLRGRITLYSVCEFLLMAILAVQVARLFWTLTTPVGPIGPWTAPVPPPVAPATTAPAALDYDPFFRSAAGADAGPVVVTALPLTLHGTREDRATGHGSAIIGTADGQQNSYAVGDEIMPGAVLSAVGSDSVTITRDGAQEQLYLGADAPAPAEAPATPQAPPQ
jgi:general secretion pathway protein C